MNVLNQISEQARELFNSLTPSARIMAGLMLGVIVVSLGWVLSGNQATSYTYLFGSQTYSDADLDRWEAAFGEAQLRDYVREGRRIKVPSNAKDAYLGALSSANALPMEWDGYMKDALTNGSPFDPNSIINARQEWALENALASVIRQMPGIEYASVQYDEAKEGFARKTERVCGISIKGHPGSTVPRETLRAIHMQAQSYFAGLSPDKIVVTDLNSSSFYRGSNGGASDPENNALLAATQDWEQHFLNKVRGSLSVYGDIRVGVTVELDPTALQESEKLAYEPTAVTLESSSSRNDTENSKGLPAGQPGAAPNGLANSPQSLSSTSQPQSSSTKKSEENEKRVASHEAIVSKQAPFVPDKVNITVGIPDSYYDKVFATRYMKANPDSAPEDVPVPSTNDLAKLEEETEQSVRSAIEIITIGARSGESKTPFVRVYKFPDLPLPAIPQPTIAETSMAWLGDSWGTIALLGVVLVSMGMAFSWVKSQGQPPGDKDFAEGFGLQVPEQLSDELDLGAGAIGEDGEPIGEAGAEGEKKTGFEVVGEDLKEDLSALINQNPDAAVNLLKSWIGEAA